MTTQKNPPLLRVAPITRTPTILTRYKRRGDGTIYAHEKWDVPARDFLVAVDDLGVSGECLDEVARALGMGYEDDATGGAA